VAMAMADAAEEVAGLAMGSLRFKWPNDIVVDAPGAPAGVRKLAGLLGESENVGTAGVRAVVGIGTNADWPRAQFPAELADTMTSLHDITGGRTVAADELLEAFLIRLEARVISLREGHFDVATWHSRQITTGRTVRVDMPDESVIVANAVGVDGATGALLIDDEASAGGERELLAGEVTHVRLAAGTDSISAGVTP
ncbi:MAG TPA: hypothetical protein VF375_08505, partial [Candidatus Limnocylindrales bacterium]